MKDKGNSSANTMHNVESSKMNIVVKCSRELQYLVTVLSEIDKKFKDDAQQAGALDRYSAALHSGK